MARAELLAAPARAGCSSFDAFKIERFDLTPMGDMIFVT